MSLTMLNRALLGAGLLVAAFAQPAAASTPTEGSAPANAPTTTTSVSSNLITGSFTGVLIDSQTRQPLSNVLVAMFRKSDDQIISGATSAADGEFRLDRAAFGHYVLRIEVPGYAPIEQQITIAMGRDVIDLGAFDLKPASLAARR